MYGRISVLTVGTLSAIGAESEAREVAMGKDGVMGLWEKYCAIRYVLKETNGFKF